VTEHNVIGMDDVKVAVAEATSSQNNLSRNGRFSPAHWEFGTLPRGPGDQFDEDEFADLEPLQGQLDPGTVFAWRAELRPADRQAFVKEDCGRRVAPAALRKVAPLSGDYVAGGFVCSQQGRFRLVDRLPHRRF
jgi:hypothetical protein